MKNLVIAMMLLTAFSFGKAQNDSKEKSGSGKNAKPPAAVVNAFQKLFAGVSATWEKEGATYEAEFEQDGNEMSVVFDRNGKLLETEKEIQLADLPENARKYLNDNFPKVPVKECAKISNPSGKIAYEAEIKGKDLLFDETGNFIGKGE